MSTRRWPAEQAFRIRVSMSATGSVRLIRGLLPASLAHAGDLALEGELPETDAAESKLPEHGPAPAAPLTASYGANLELRCALCPLNPSCFGHVASTNCVNSEQ